MNITDFNKQKVFEVYTKINYFLKHESKSMLLFDKLKEFVDDAFVVMPDTMFREISNFVDGVICPYVYGTKHDAEELKDIEAQFRAMSIVVIKPYLTSLSVVPKDYSNHKWLNCNGNCKNCMLRDYDCCETGE